MLPTKQLFALFLFLSQIQSIAPSGSNEFKQYDISKKTPSQLITGLAGVCHTKNEEGISNILKSTRFKVDSKTKTGKNAFHVACECGNVGLLENLLKIFPKNKAMNAKDQDGKTALHYAAEKDPSLVALLLKAGANLNELDQLHRSPLYYACVEGKLEAVKLFLFYDVIPDEKVLTYVKNTQKIIHSFGGDTKDLDEILEMFEKITQ